MDSNYFDEESLNSLIQEICELDDIKLEDIPEYRLYISQVEEFFDKKLSGNLTSEEDKKLISKTMIQNYIKDGLLMSPEGKCYNRGHVILLTLIYNLKSILTIKDIKKLLQPVLNLEEEEKQESIKNIYSSYLELKNIKLGNNEDSLIENVNMVKEFCTEKKMDSNIVGLLMLVMNLITQANQRKKLAERIISSYFTTQEVDENKD